MKKLLIIFLSALLSVVGIERCFGQVPNSEWKKELNGRHLRSVVSINKEPNKDSSNEKQVGMGKTASRDLFVNYKNSKTMLTMTIIRLQQKGNSLNGVIEVDTDSPFPSNEEEKSVTEHYLQFIKIPLVIELNDNGEVLTQKEPKLPIRGQWRADLPKLNQCQELTGIIQDLPKNNTQTWTDSLFDERQNGIFVNVYSIIEDNTKIKKIAIKGNFIPNKAETETVKIANQKDATIPTSGTTIQAISTVNSISYEGVIIVENSSHVINNMSLKMNKSETMSVLGQSHERQLQLYYEVNNKVK